MRLLIFLAAALLMGTPALAQHNDTDPANTPETEVLSRCLDDVSTRANNGEKVRERDCVGKLADPCLENPESQTTQGMASCIRMEADWWDQQLNLHYQQLRRQLPREEFFRLRDMQRKWIAFKEAKCRFEYDSWQGGSLAQITTADCILQTTADQALFLRQYIERGKL